MGLFDVFKKKTLDRSAAQKGTEHRADKVANVITPKCSSCGIAIPSARTKCVSCEWAENKFSNNREVFKMVTKEGQLYNFTYLGYTRYHPNRASTCGYGSDDWIYLCEEGNDYYLLMFSNDASCGPGWLCTKLLEDDYEKLVNANIDYWGRIAYSKERDKIYGIRLRDTDGVRHLLPTGFPAEALLM